MKTLEKKVILLYVYKQIVLNVSWPLRFAAWATGILDIVEWYKDVTSKLSDQLFPCMLKDI